MEGDERGDDALRVTYRLACRDEAAARRRARAIALEQTVELPADCIDEEIERRVVGRVESIERAAGARWDAVVAYPGGVVGGDVAQLCNVLFGNASLQRGILVTRVEPQRRLLDRLGRPRFGVDGLREICGVLERRPLLCAALKPLGLGADQLARRCFELAAGGIDLIKDDHGLAAQAWAPFDERVARCREAVESANARFGRSALYVPNLTGTARDLARRADTARGHGCRAVLVAPLLAGPGAVRWIAEGFDLAVLSHPALCGAYFGRNHGIVPEVLLGRLFRLFGSDGVIYPNAGGRFPFSEATCAAVHGALLDPLGSVKPAFPVLGGGIDVKKVEHWIERYGPDTVFLIGGSLYRQGDLRRAAEGLLRVVLRGR